MFHLKSTAHLGSEMFEVLLVRFTILTWKQQPITLLFATGQTNPRHNAVPQLCSGIQHLHRMLLLREVAVLFLEQ
jgi:hypothetical protein